TSYLYNVHIISTTLWRNSTPLIFSQIKCSCSPEITELILSLSACYLTKSKMNDLEEKKMKNYFTVHIFCQKPEICFLIQKTFGNSKYLISSTRIDM